MSVQGNYSGNLQKLVTLNLGGTSLTDIGTAIPKQPLALASFIFANPTGGAVDCSLYWHQAVTATDYLIWMKTVASKDTQIISDMPVRLFEGDKIKAIGAANVRVSLIYLGLLQLTS